MAETILSKGQITIIDLHDARQIQAYLNPSLGAAQQYNPDTKAYSPNYTAAAPNIISASVYETGNSANRITDVTGVVWTVNGVDYAAGTTKDGFVASQDSLKITTNISANQLNVKFSATVADSVTNQNIKVEALVTIIKSQSAGALFSVIVTAPSGNVFNQNVTGNLTAVAHCYRGGTEDTSGTTYKWQKLTSTGWVDVSAGKANGATLTVANDDVLNFQTFKVIATDDGNTAEALITFEDKTDPYEVQLFCPTGNIIKNGQGSTKIQASVWQKGTMVESVDTPAASLKFNYTWEKYNDKGVKDTAFSATGNEITVTSAQVTEKATFSCQITKK